MALPASDDFNRANGALGADWTTVMGSILIESNQVRPSSGGNDSLVYWSSDVFANDQYAELTYAAEGTFAPIGPAVRVSGTSSANANGYALHLGTDANGNARLMRFLNGTGTILSTSTGWVAGDIARIEADGTTIRVKRNGVELSSITDSNVASGSAGMSSYNAFGGERGDNWSGGDLNALVLPIPRPALAVYRM